MKATTIARCLMFALPLVFLGCGGQHDHAHEGEHAHEHGEDADHEHARDDVDAMNTAALAPTEVAALYSCPMHPEVTAAEPGRCSKCNMFLTRPDTDHGHDHAEGEDHDHGDHSHEGGDGPEHDEDGHEKADGGEDDEDDEDDHSHDHGDHSHQR